MTVDAHGAAALRAGFVLGAEQRRVAALLAGLVADGRGRRGCLSGLYLWGPVGIGKTWLATTAFDAVPLDEWSRQQEQCDADGSREHGMRRHLRFGPVRAASSTVKRRWHFHALLAEVHDGYARNRGRPGAIDRAVDQVLDGVGFLMLDEVHVHDAGTAMLVARLLRGVAARRITVPATANCAPSGLLPDPLHHHLIAPVVAAIEDGMRVETMRGDVDHRTIAPSRGRYLAPGTDDQLRAAGLRPPAPGEAGAVVLHGRRAAARAVRADEVWFGFAELCGARTAAADYVALAARHRAWVLTGLTRLRDDPDAAQRFAHLVDVLVDRGVRLTLTGSAPLDELLAGARVPDVERLRSRLSLLAAEDRPVRGRD